MHIRLDLGSLEGMGGGKPPPKVEGLACTADFLPVASSFGTPWGLQKKAISQSPQRIKDDWAGPLGDPEAFKQILRVSDVILKVLGLIFALFVNIFWTNFWQHSWTRQH